jgi:hypothetical protein
MGCCFTKESDVFPPPSPPLTEPLVERYWIHLAAPGEEEDILYENPFELERPSSPETFLIN